MQRRSFLKRAGMAAVAAGTLNRAAAEDNAQTGPSPKTILPEKPGDGAIRIAVVQQEGNPGQVEINRNKALGFAREALDKNADAILFHEEMLVGYVENLRELAEPVDGPTTQAFRELLKGTDTKIIYGLTERDGDNYYISAPIVSGEGLVGNYRKAHLWWRAEGLRHEPTFYKAGRELVTFDVKGHKCGVMICYDGGFPEMARSYANLDCSVLFWMNNRRSRANREVRDLAFSNSLYMPTSCCCGLNERGLFCEGASNITGPEGELITELWNDEGIVMADITPEKAFALREKNYKYKGLRSDIYYYK